MALAALSQPDEEAQLLAAPGGTAGAAQPSPPSSPGPVDRPRLRTRIRSLPIAAIVYIPLGLCWLFLVCGLSIVYNVATLGRRRTRAMEIFAPAVARGLLWIFGIRLRIHGREHLPTASSLKRSQVIVCNHTSFLDGLAVCALCPHAMLFVAKREIMFVPVLGIAWALTGQFMINRKSRTEARSTMDQLRDQLIRADAAMCPRQVIMFPEGTRSSSGRLQPFKRGAFHLAQQLGTAIVPLVVRGAFELSPGKAEWHMVPGEFSIMVHPTIDASSWTPDTVAHEATHVHAQYRRWLAEPPAISRAGSELIDGPFTTQY